MERITKERSSSRALECRVTVRSAIPDKSLPRRAHRRGSRCESLQRARTRNVDTAPSCRRAAIVPRERGAGRKQLIDQHANDSASLIRP